jgi:hypothetical protein
MLLNSLHFPSGGRCTLSYDKPNGWLRTIWTGNINNEQAMQGATNYLEQVGPLHCLYFLNDNVGLQGSWFNSTQWLKSTWLPQAQRLGLRYVAHVVQRDTHTDILTLNPGPKTIDAIELQLFYDVAAAEEWLRSCQQPPASIRPYLPLT